jgi:ABC-type lipoprotein release transport system permease subunit
MTLGARPVDVLRELLAESLRHAATGLAIGVSAGVLLMKLGAAVLFGVTPWDPMTLIAVAGVVFAASAVASLIPAARAMRVDPVVALRQD